MDANNESIKAMRMMIKEKTRFIQQTSSEVASQAAGLLKSESIATDGSKSPFAQDESSFDHQVVKIDRSFMQRLFGVVTAGMIAVSAYAYLV